MEAADIAVARPHRQKLRRRLLAHAPQNPQLVGSLVEVHEQVTGLLGDPGTSGVRRGADDVDLAGGEFQEEQHVDPFEVTVSTVKKSQATMPRVCAVKNCCQVGPARRGAGSTPARCRIFHTVLAATVGHRMPGVRGIYSHVTPAMQQRITDALQDRWRASQPRPAGEHRHLHAA